MISSGHACVRHRKREREEKKRESGGNSTSQQKHYVSQKRHNNVKQTSQRFFFAPEPLLINYKHVPKAARYMCFSFGKSMAVGLAGPEQLRLIQLIGYHNSTWPKENNINGRERNLDDGTLLFF